jgi:hypothetical protein
MHGETDSTAVTAAQGRGILSAIYRHPFDLLVEGNKN